MSQNNSGWTQSKTFLKIISIVIAFFCWLFVASVGNTVRNNTVKNVPINIENQEKLLSELGINIIEISATEVTAEIKGERIEVGKVQPEDLTATIKIPNQLDNFENELALVLVPKNPISINDKNYEIVSYDPEYITVRLDKMETKTVPIEVRIDSNINVSEGYIQQKIAIDPEAVTISGPKQEIDKISSAEVKFNIDHELSESYVNEHEIQLVDKEGNVVNLEKSHIKLDETSARVVIPVVKERKLPLTIGFINEPRNFPTNKLEYKRSDEQINLAGDPKEIERYNEIVLGYVDISKLSKSKNQFTFDVDLPDNFINLDNIQTVTVTFNSDNWVETTLDANEIKLLNIPDGYNVELITDAVTGVKIVGEKEIVEALTSEDLIAEINFAEKKEISLGQYQYPVKISAPAQDGLVWINDEYSIVIKVAAIENYS